MRRDSARFTHSERDCACTNLLCTLDRSLGNTAAVLHGAHWMRRQSNLLSHYFLRSFLNHQRNNFASIASILRRQDMHALQLCAHPRCIV